jgi:hypothetical protein
LISGNRSQGDDDLVACHFFKAGAFSVKTAYRLALDMKTAADDNNRVARADRKI